MSENPADMVKRRDNPTNPAWTRDALSAPHDATDKASRVRRMFNAIAPRYELINTLFSAGRDAVWRRRAVHLVGAGPKDVVLDIACGTGDFARVFHGVGSKLVVGCDFAGDMLTLAASRGQSGLHWCEGDALRLPFRDAGFTIASCAFGVRNLQDLGAGLAEMFRVLRPGGRVVILEFSRPSNRIARALYELYSTRLMPVAASLVSGDRSGAYRYLPRSVVSFHSADQMCAELQQAGFTDVTARPLTFGVVTVYTAVRR